VEQKYERVQREGSLIKIGYLPLRMREIGSRGLARSRNLSPRFAPRAHNTKRSGEIIAVVGRALGGRPGRRLMRRLGIPRQRRYADPASQKNGAPACIAPADPRPWLR
jgi:hypothetical protein